MKTYKRYHPLIWILTITPIIILTFGVPYFNSNKVVFGLDYMSAFLIVMDFITSICMWIAYRIGEKTNQRRGQ